MKKNPIDELFAKKLAEHRQEPSQRALEKFQERLAQREQKRRGGLFVWNRQWNYYAAAASVVAVLSIGVLSIRDNAPQLAHTETPKTEVFNQNNAQKSGIASIQPEKSIVAEKNIPQKQKIQNFTVSSKISAESNLTKTEIAVAQTQPEEKQPITVTTEPTQTNTSIASVTEPVAQTETPQITLQVESIGNKPVSAEESIVLVYNEILETPKPESTIAEEKEDEKSFISKLFKEYQHLKYGEKVDLKTLGINKREVLARVDERLFKEEREDLKDFMQSRIGRFKKIQE